MQDGLLVAGRLHGKEESVMNYIKISPYDIANGAGVRVILWVAGCEHHCLNCHNPDTWDSWQAVR